MRIDLEYSYEEIAAGKPFSLRTFEYIKGNILGIYAFIVMCIVIAGT